MTTLSYQNPDHSLPELLAGRIKEALGTAPLDLAPLSGGSVGEVYRAKLASGHDLVIKIDLAQNTQLALEGSMLEYLAGHSSLPVPQVLFNDGQLLITEFVPGKSIFSAKSQQHAAELLAELHGITARSFGFEYDTLIGGLHQPNNWTNSWIDFFRQQRLLFMASKAYEHDRLPQSIYSRLQAFSERLEDFLEEPFQPSLLHGDAWAGNILANGDRITAFLDPAIYFGHPEIELAFTTLFGTFGDPFFKRYNEIWPLAPGFMELRKDIYNLFPLLVHVRLFGGSYVGQVEGILRRLRG